MLTPTNPREDTETWMDMKPGHSSQALRTQCMWFRL